MDGASQATANKPCTDRQDSVRREESRKRLDVGFDSCQKRSPAEFEYFAEKRRPRPARREVCLSLKDWKLFVETRLRDLVVNTRIHTNAEARRVRFRETLLLYLDH